MELWKSLQFHTCCEPCNLFSPFVLCRTTAGSSYKFCLPWLGFNLQFRDRLCHWRAVYNALLPENQPGSTFSSSELLSSVYHLLFPLYQKEIPAFLLFCLFSLCSWCQWMYLLLVFTYLKAACLSFLLSSVTAGLYPKRMQGCISWGLNFGVFITLV